MEKVKEPPLDGTFAPVGTVDRPEVHSSMLSRENDCHHSSGREIYSWPFVVMFVCAAIRVLPTKLGLSAIYFISLHFGFFDEAAVFIKAYLVR